MSLPSRTRQTLVISGWIRVTGNAKVAVWAPEGVAVVTRKSNYLNTERKELSGFGRALRAITNTFRRGVGWYKELY